MPARTGSRVAGRGSRGVAMPATRLDLVVAGEDAGERLDVFLARAPEVGSRAAAQRLIEAGGVTVNGAAQAKNHRVAGGDRVVAEIEERVAEDPGEAGEGVPHEVVYEDEALIVVDKPAGVGVHPSAGHATGTLAQALAGRAAGGDDPRRPGVVHPLHPPPHRRPGGGG